MARMLFSWNVIIRTRVSNILDIAILTDRHHVGPEFLTWLRLHTLGGKCRIAAGRDRLSIRRAEVNRRRPARVDQPVAGRFSHSRARMA